MENRWVLRNLIPGSLKRLDKGGCLRASFIQAFREGGVTQR